METRRLSLVRILKLLCISALFLSAVLYIDYAYGLRGRPDVLSRRGQTEHFRIHTDVDDAQLEYYKNFFEGFFDYVNAEYFEIGQNRRLKVYLFGSEKSYRPFAQSARSGYTPYGFYMGPWANIIVVNADSGLGTTTHELVHHFIATSFAADPPKWVDEGIATFFEKFIGYLDEQGKLNISFGYFSNWRFPQTKKRARFLSIEGLVTLEEPDQSAARSLMLFLHRQGLFKKFVHEMSVAADDPTGVVTLEKVCGKDVSQIERDWKEWVMAQPIDGNVNLVPQAFVLPVEHWKTWCEKNSSRLYWSETEQMYRVRE